MSNSVLITNASWSIAHGLLKIANKIDIPIRTVGISLWPFSAANHLADTIIEAPGDYSLANQVNLDFIRSICTREEIQLIIPTTDIETVQLREIEHELPAIACSNLKASRICYDKLETYKHLTEKGIPFAATVLPSQYSKQFCQTVVKPRTGGLLTWTPEIGPG